MAAFSDYLEAGILSATLRGQALSTPSSIYIALFTGDPNDDASGFELTDSAYLRQNAAKGESISNGWTAPSVSGDGMVSSNAKVIQFPPIADGSVTLSHYGVFDSQTGGNLLYHGAFTVAKTLEVNDVLSIDIGGLQIILR